MNGEFDGSRFLDNSRTFLNIGFWAKLKEGPSDIIIPDVAIVR